MVKAFATLALVVVTGGCAVSPAGLVLVFASNQDKGAATHAQVLVVTPPSAVGDQCPQFLAFPPPDPDPSQIELTLEVDLVNGAATKPLKGIPVGRQTLLVRVDDKTGNVFLHGCRTGIVTSGASFDVKLLPVTAPVIDMAPQDAAVDMALPPADLAMPRTLSVTTTEIRANGRVLSGVSVTVTDSAGTAVGPKMTDASGNAKLDVTTLVPPLSVTATAPAVNSFQGAAVVTGLSPTLATGTIPLTVPIELDPPVATASNSIVVTATYTGVSTFDAYYLATNAFPGEIQKITASASPITVQPLISGSTYRLAVVPTGTAAMATPSAISSAGSATFAMTDFKPFTTPFTPSVTKSTAAAYSTSQQYGVMMVLPAAFTQAPIPIVADTNITVATTGSEPAVNLPSMANSVQGAAIIETEEVAIGPNARGEIRHQLAAMTPANDLLPAVPDPPTVTLTPASPVAATASFTIAATPPAAFLTSNAFVHVRIHGAGPPQYNAHLVAPFASPAMITVPANMLPVGSYTVDVAFVQDFALADGSVQATLLDDYSKLLRQLPAELSQATVALTVN